MKSQEKIVDTMAWPPSEELMKNLHQEISNATIEQKAKMWCDLNTYKFPTLLEHLKPTDYDHTSPKETHNFVWDLMTLITDQIGMKECLREWNKDRMSNEEFETWWGHSKTFFGN